MKKHTYLRKPRPRLKRGNHERDNGVDKYQNGYCPYDMKPYWNWKFFQIKKLGGSVSKFRNGVTN